MRYPPDNDKPIGCIRFIITVAIFITPSLFCFWLSNWHRHVDVLLNGETTTAYVVNMREEWSRMPNLSGQEAYKSYYLWLEYADRDGIEHFTVWDASSDLFSSVQIGYPIEISYLPGDDHAIIPKGETFQAFTDSGEYGLAGVGGLIFLGAVTFLIIAMFKEGRVRGV